MSNPRSAATHVEIKRRNISMRILKVMLYAGSFVVPTLILPAQTPLAASASDTSGTATRQAEAFPVTSGDLLDVRVFDTVELSAQARVNESGEILLPVTGLVQVGGLTPDQVALKVQNAIQDQKIMTDPRVTVLVSEYATQRVTVTGEVKSPGVYALLGRHDLYYVLSAAGGPTANQGAIITVTHKSDPSHPLTVPVDSPNYSSIIRQTTVSAGDTVVVGRGGVFYVVGDVGKAGAFYLQNGQPVNVLNALALAQSPNYTASTSHISLLRKSNDNKTEVIPINVKEISQAKQPDVDLRDGDILFVPGSAFKRIALSAVPSLAGAAASSGTIAAH
jgi:polysaccharide export outer membrane protein